MKSEFYQFLFAVLKAINEDSPTVPTLLTDYILKGILLMKLFSKNTNKNILLQLFAQHKTRPDQKAHSAEGCA